MKVVQGILVLVLAAFSLQACAFKEDEGAGDEASPAEEGVHPLDGSLAGVGVSWEGRPKPIDLASGEFVRRDLVTWHRDAPLTVPALVPDALDLRLLLYRDPQDLQSAQLTVDGLDGEGIETHKLGIEKVETTPGEKGALVTFRLKGLQMVFRADTEQRFFLNIQMFRGGLLLARVRLLLTTPPSALPEVTRETREQVEARDQTNDLLPTVLHSQALTLVLVEKVIFRNDSWAPVSFHLPFRFQGHTHSTIREYWPQRAEHPNPFVAYNVQGSEDRVTTKDYEIFVVPGREDIGETWPQLASEEQRRLTVEPGASLEVGLFIPEQAENDLKLSRSVFTWEELASVDATARCNNRVIDLPESRDGDEGVGHCARLNDWGYSYPPASIEACKAAIRANRRCRDSGWAKGPCDAAALADWTMSQNRAPHPNNGIPWVPFMGCELFETNADGRLGYIHYGWTWEQIWAPFRRGFEWQGARIAALEGMPMEGALRFESGSAEANVEVRKMELFRTPTLVK